MLYKEFKEKYYKENVWLEVYDSRDTLVVAGKFRLLADEKGEGIYMLLYKYNIYIIDPIALLSDSIEYVLDLDFLLDKKIDPNININNLVREISNSQLANIINSYNKENFIVKLTFLEEIETYWE